ncbi:MAG: protein translocase subunit SecF [Ignavibacteria bacterium]|nr:protein translocase subunit SecF [Ignavibacteria bacterium]MBT8382211.1 protein translocase subunit SecF [Ignavibacteria bacterium]MBT8390920.1 protein translocase subunit SecF [Ignavibacteria bacterium]NNJ53933.1 protein translocase subunit SecF [Ignavibacteriaceae bacterium]NNL20586.1 protein translocase subunit SecF [Ignavibacteriaceae bacterium]
MRIFENLNFDFLGKRKIAYAISGIIFLISVISVVTRGFHFGIDFKGGSEIVLQFQDPVDIAVIRGYLSNIGLGDVEVKTFGGETGVMIRTEEQVIPSDVYPQVVAGIEKEIEKIMPGVPRQIIDSAASSVTYAFENTDTTNTLVDALFDAGFQSGRISEEPDNTQMIVSVGIADWLKENLREKVADNPFTILKEDRVGPKIGDELKRDALLAMIFALIAILIYLGFRFKFIFAIGAVAALFHDVLITFGLFAVLYGVIPGLNLDIDLTVVAAFLTLIGYSINDTVVNFDRIRENIKIHKTRPLFDIINTSISQTMSRTILTSGTTLITILVLLIFGGEVLKVFAFTLLFGIIIGTYSSIFVASTLVYEYATKYKKKVEF